MNAPSPKWTVFAVFRKEVLDALRETRTLLVVLGSALLVGPLAAAFMLTSVPPEPETQTMDLLVSGLQSAPSLKAYLDGQNVRLRSAPPDFETRLSTGALHGPVVAVARDFETALARGDAPLIEVLSGNGGQGAEIDAARTRQLLDGFVRQQVGANLQSHGLTPQVLEPVRVESRSLVPPRSAAQTFAGALPFLLIMAVLFGALNAALDTTCGERERGSLEPLLTNPSQHGALVLGKWGAVVAVSALVAVLSCLSLMLTLWLMRSERLDAMLQFGPREALLAVLLMLPYAAALPAVLMAVAIRCRTFKEAQANSNLVILLLSALPILTVIVSGGGVATWQLLTPVLAQMVLIGQVFNGEPLSALQMLLPLVVGIVLTVASIWFVAINLRQAAAK